MARSEYLAVVEQYGPGAYGAYVPELPGIGVAGETEAEVRALVTDAIRLYLDELGQGGTPKRVVAGARTKTRDGS